MQKKTTEKRIEPSGTGGAKGGDNTRRGNKAEERLARAIDDVAAERRHCAVRYDWQDPTDPRIGAYRGLLPDDAVSVLQRLGAEAFEQSFIVERADFIDIDIDNVEDGGTLADANPRTLIPNKSATWGPLGFRRDRHP